MENLLSTTGKEPCRHRENHKKTALFHLLYRHCIQTSFSLPLIILIGTLLILPTNLYSEKNLERTSPVAVKNNNATVRLNINTFTSTGINRITIKKMTSILYRELVRLHGNECILYRKQGGLNKSANRQLTGSVEIIDTRYYITIKVLDGEKGEQIYNKTCTTNSTSLNKTLREIAKDIHKSHRVWRR